MKGIKSAVAAETGPAAEEPDLGHKWLQLYGSQSAQEKIPQWLLILKSTLAQMAG